MVSSVFMFTPMPGDMIQFDQDFSNGLKPPTRNCFDVVFWQDAFEKTLQLCNGTKHVLQVKNEDGYTYENYLSI